MSNIYYNSPFNTTPSPSPSSVSSPYQEEDFDDSEALELTIEEKVNNFCTVAINSQTNLTIKDLKTFIHKEMKLKKETMRILSQGKELEDSELLANLPFSSNLHFHLIV